MKTELVTSLKRHATEIIADLQDEHNPILITQHGKPAAYLVDVDTFDEMTRRMQILEGIARGEQAIKDGRVMSHEQAKTKMRRWLK
jgi:prevent-host-death family protein